MKNPNAKAKMKGWLFHSWVVLDSGGMEIQTIFPVLHFVVLETFRHNLLL